MRDVELNVPRHLFELRVCSPPCLSHLDGRLATGKWLFSHRARCWLTVREVVKYLRQHELAKTPLAIVALGYLEGGKNVFRFGGVCVALDEQANFFYRVKKCEQWPKLSRFDKFRENLTLHGDGCVCGT